MYLGDCLEVMPNIEDKSIDCIICDLPYGITQNNWDSVIDLNSLWENYKRIIKENGAIILFGQDKFTMQVMASNLKWHRYNLIWNKINPVGFLNANHRPLTSHEDIMVFYKKQPVYNPQKFLGDAPSHRRCRKGTLKDELQKTNGNYGDHFIGDYTEEITQSSYKFPKSILDFKRVPPSKCIHPTQKPVELIKWLIKTYTNEGDLVLDNCMGSGTTGVACKESDRRFIGIEKDEEYFNIAKNRIKNYSFTYDMFEDF